MLIVKITGRHRRIRLQVCHVCLCFATGSSSKGGRAGESGGEGDENGLEGFGYI